MSTSHKFSNDLQNKLDRFLEQIAHLIFPGYQYDFQYLEKHAEWGVDTFDEDQNIYWWHIKLFNTHGQIGINVETEDLIILNEIDGAYFLEIYSDSGKYLHQKPYIL